MIIYLRIMYNRMSNPSFINWLINTYKNTDSPEGDLVRDIIEDKKINKWRGSSYNSLIKRIKSLTTQTHTIKIAEKTNEIYKNNILKNK